MLLEGRILKPQRSGVETTAPRPLTIFELEQTTLFGEEASTQPTNSLGIQNVTVRFLVYLKLRN